jgi:hypothetical protein
MNVIQQRWANRMGLTPTQFKKLLRLTNHAARMMELEHNVDCPQVRAAAKVAVELVDNYAKRLKLEVDWNPGLYPLFGKIGGSRFRMETIPEK